MKPRNSKKKEKKKRKSVPTKNTSRRLDHDNTFKFIDCNFLPFPCTWAPADPKSGSQFLANSPCLCRQHLLKVCGPINEKEWKGVSQKLSTFVDFILYSEFIFSGVKKDGWAKLSIKMFGSDQKDYGAQDVKSN